jgi:hypothetical protein
LTLDGTVRIGLVAQLLNQLVAETLVIALKVVMLRVFLHGFSKVALAQRDELGQTLGFGGANEALRVSVQIGASHRKLHCLHAGGLEKLAERPCGQRIAVVDEIASW